MMESEAQSYPDIRQYLGILKTRKWTVVISVIIVFLLALAYSARQTLVYTAQATLLIKPDPNTNYYPNAENEAAIITSAPVAALVIDELGLETSPDALLGSVEAARQSTTADVILVSYSSIDPEEARDMANAFAANYIQYRASQARGTLDEQRQNLQKKIVAIGEDLSATAQALEQAQRRGDESLVLELESERATQAARLAILEQQLDALTGAAATTTIGEILEPAVTPGSPSSPNHAMNGALGLVAGLGIGIAMAFLKERLDDRFKGRADLERVLESPVLATVPKFTGSRRAQGTNLPVINDPRGPASEAFRNLRTGLQFVVSREGIRSILVTSASAGEGKTSTTANLAIALSQTGRRVVMISADLRRPALESHFEVKADLGLSSWLLGEEDQIERLLLEHPQLPNLTLMPAGKVPSNPAELLTSPRMPQLLEQLQASFDLTLIDSPPLLPVADSIILASYADAVLLVVDAGSTARSAAMHAREQVQRVGGHLVGCVLNAFDPSTTPYYYEPYYYSTYYGKGEKPPEGSSNGLSLASEVQDLHADYRS